MKKELLEYLIRECVKEVLEAFPEPETTGAPAPPAAGQGTADQPAIPKAEPASAAPTTSTQPIGVFFVDPVKAKDERYKGDPVKNLAGKDPAQVERELYRMAARRGGPRVKIAGQTLRDIPKVLAGQIPAMYLYLGPKGPEYANEPEIQTIPDEGEDIKLFPVTSLPAAKKLSVPPGISAEHPTTQITPRDPGYAIPQQGPEAAQKTTAPDIDEGTKLHNMISGMIKEALAEMRRK